jgi:hypothetical protein
MIVINNIISFLLTLTIVFVAPLMISYAGFLFVVNPVNAGGKEKAKHVLTNTVVGIVIALAAWMIVDAVMAVLYKPASGSAWGTWSSLITGSDKLCIPLAGTLSQVTPTVPGVEVPPPMATDEASVRARLAAASITINKSPCTAEQMTGPKCGTSPGPSCTNVAGMQPATIQQIINIANACGNRPGFNPCGVQVTGGTEPGHACGTYSHEKGYKVDLWQTTGLNTYLEKFSLTGQRGGHFSGPIRKDTCDNEYVKESSPTIWDITVKALCGTTTSNPTTASVDRDITGRLIPDTPTGPEGARMCETTGFNADGTMAGSLPPSPGVGGSNPCGSYRIKPADTGYNCGTDNAFLYVLEDYTRGGLRLGNSIRWGMPNDATLVFKFKTGPVGDFNPGLVAYDSSQISSQGPSARRALLTLSESKCDFDTTKVGTDGCYRVSESGLATFYPRVTTGSFPYCVMKPDTTYYLNIRYEDGCDELLCGNLVVFN